MWNCPLKILIFLQCFLQLVFVEKSQKLNLNVYLFLHNLLFSYWIFIHKNVISIIKWQQDISNIFINIIQNIVKLLIVFSFLILYNITLFCNFNYCFCLIFAFVLFVLVSFCGTIILKLELHVLSNTQNFSFIVLNFCPFNIP